MNIEKFLRSSIVSMKAPAYPSPEKGALQLDANTNLLGLNPAVNRVLGGPTPDVAQYPSAFSDDLRASLSSLHGVPVEEVLVGNGSDEVLDFLTKAFLNPGDILAVPSPSFVMHKFYGRVNLAEVLEIPLLDGYQLDVDGILGHGPKVVVLASPNNPTGNSFRTEDIERILRESHAIVIVDEAYAHFAESDFASRTAEFDNMVVIRTFSKAYGLAGVRVGYGLAQKQIMDRLYTVKPPFTVGTLAERIAVEALADDSFMRSTVSAVKKETVRLSRKLTELGLTPRPTNANFLMIDLGRSASDVVASLKAKQILVRDMTGFADLKTHIRVTIGKPEHSDRLLEALRGVMAG